jgi:hypothetical protein
VDGYCERLGWAVGLVECSVEGSKCIFDGMESSWEGSEVREDAQTLIDQTQKYESGVRSAKKVSCPGKMSR